MINNNWKKPEKPEETLPLVKHSWAYRNVVGLIFLGIFVCLFGYLTYIGTLHYESIIKTSEASCEELETALKEIYPDLPQHGFHNPYSPSLDYALDKYFAECVNDV